MKTNPARIPSLSLLALLALTAELSPALAQGTGFTYQGRLLEQSAAVSGTYDLRFSLYDAAVSGTVVGSAVAISDVSISNGLFTVSLDFGAGVFDGSPRWLQIGVRTNGLRTFSTLTPRQELTATPYAQYAPSAGTAAVSAAVSSLGITTGMLADGSVTSGKLAAGAVKLSAIDDGGSGAYTAFQQAVRAAGGLPQVPFSGLAPLVIDRAESPAWSLTLAGVPFGSVIGFSGTEAISQPYAYYVQVRYTGDPVDPASKLGLPGQLVFVHNGRETLFRGLVTSCALSSSDGKALLYTLRLESPLAYLAISSDYRVHQDQTAPEVAAALYQDVTGRTVSERQTGSYPPRPYLVQFAETDLNFFDRILEYEGIFYFFDHGVSPPALALADSPSQLPSGPALSYFGDTRTNLEPNLEFIRRFQRATHEASFKSTLKSYDFEKPSLLLLASSTGTGAHGESYDFVPETVPGELDRLAKARQERQEVDRLLIDAAATSPDLRAGYTFDLTDQSNAGLAGHYLVARIQHAGFSIVTNGVTTFYYGNEFQALPASSRYRPALLASKPLAQPCLAKVTGPATEEIHVDKYGRVKVHFVWDRSGPVDDHSSAWIRVANSWAGNGHGVLFLPRVGDEVLVDFVQGDPDQPVVIGSLFNGSLPPLYSLPDFKTRSYIRTLSSKGGGGMNEIMFDDLKGSELFSLTAQKDFDYSVGNDLTSEVGHDSVNHVGNNFTLAADGSLVVVSGGPLSLSANSGLSFTGGGMGVNTAPDPAAALKVNGTVAATAFQGDGAGLTHIQLSALPAQIALLDSNNTFAAQNTFVGPVALAGGTLAFAPFFMNDQDIFSRNDTYHGLGWYGAGKPFAGVQVNGPVLYGFSGGGLGYRNFTTTNLVLTWNASGNVGINTSSTAAALDVRDNLGNGGIIHVGAAVTGGDPKLVRFGDGDYVHVGENGIDDQMELKAATFFFNHQSGAGRVGLGTNNPQTTLHVVGNILATGTITPNSDRNAKTDFAPVDTAAVLERVAALPIQQWRFKGEAPGIQHLGPMAQDFRAAFGLGEVPTAIATVDADGVALAALQALNHKLETEVAARDARIETLEQRLEQLEQSFRRYNMSPEAAGDPALPNNK